MGKLPMDRTETTRVEAILMGELDGGNRALRGVAPVVAHMLEASGPAMVSDAVVARLRGMLADLATQLLGGRQANGQPASQSQIDELSLALGTQGDLLDHLYALAMEGYLTDRLEQRSGVDPVLTGLFQELIASDKPAVAELAMNTLAAQSRFVQSQRRMQHAISELPAELFALATRRFTDFAMANEIDPKPAVARLREQFDEGAGRLGLLARLVSTMGNGAIAALSLDHAGLALFASALSMLTRQPRDISILACHERQAARLGLSLRAAGLGPQEIESAFVLLDPLASLPHGIGSVPPERAQEMIAGDVV